MIALRGLTRRFPGGRGIFDLSFEVAEGEAFGYLGPNGAGKTTTIRHLMGFLRADAGVAEIDGLDAWSEAARVQERVGYVPGELGFPDEMTGTEFLALLAGMRSLADTTWRDDLLARFDLEPATPIRKMSKGTKQKLALVAAFMHRPRVLILDEPTSGLDPLMQRRFLDLLGEEHVRGTTVLISSHAFVEVERLCDRVGIIKDGRLVAAEDVRGLRQAQRKVFRVGLGGADDAATLRAAGLTLLREDGDQVDVEVRGDYAAFVRALATVDVRSLDVHELDLEEVFMQFYGAGEVRGDESSPIRHAPSQGRAERREL